MKINNNNQCAIIDLKKISDTNGNLTYIESFNQIPFAIKRVYYLYDVPGGSYRGAHAHKKLHQLIIAMSGSFNIEIDDGKNKKVFHLNRSYYGLYLPPMTWRYLDNFSTGATCLVLASDFYKKSDYIRNYEEFIIKANKLR